MLIDTAADAKIDRILLRQCLIHGAAVCIVDAQGLTDNGWQAEFVRISSRA